MVYSHYTGGPDLKKLVDDHEFLFEMPEYTVDSLSDTLLKALKKLNSNRETVFATILRQMRYLISHGRHTDNDIMNSCLK